VPAAHDLGLLLGAVALEDRGRELEQLGGRRVRLCGRPADNCSSSFVCEQFLELGMGLVGGDHDHLHRSEPADQPVERFGDLLQVLPDERLDVTLVTGLRPASLVVLAGLLLGVVGELLQSSAAEPIELPAFAADDEDKGALPAPNERNERREVERAAHLHLVGHGLGERERPPDVVEARGEDREPVGAVPFELPRIEVTDALEVCPQADTLVVRQVAAVRAFALRRLVEERMEPRDGVGGRRGQSRVEAQIEADRTALLRLEASQVTKLVPGDRACHQLPAVRFLRTGKLHEQEGSKSLKRLLRRSMNSVDRKGAVSTNDVREVIIIGGGPAGYTAALYAARANLNPLVIEGFAWGGQLMITSDVENYPGYPEGILGPEMMQDFRKQAERFGTEFINDDVTRVDFSERPFSVWVGDTEYRAESIIVATGANARQLGLESEKTLQGRGVSYCAVCDAAFFKDREVVVVGGGDSAMEEATFLAKFAPKVTVVHRRESFRASPIMVDRARSNDRIEFVLDSVVEEVLGTDGGCVTGVVIRNVKTGEKTELQADGLFVAIGHDPNTALFRGQLEMDEAGYIITKSKTTETNVPGVFAAGDVQDHVYRQAVTAAGSGTMAALDAERWLAAQHGQPEAALATPRNW
jgi:thioredoxin reductase (NADPH)